MNRWAETVGDSPLIESDGVFAKLECVNPTGSIKDRIVRYILDESIRLGLLRPGQPIVEATSGNTGIALAYAARERGHPASIVMPEHMTEERKKLIRGLGAELVLVSQEGSFAEAVEVRDRIARETGAFNFDQFANPLNAECHERTTGRELLEAMKGRRIDAFVAGVGTGGTLMGVGAAVKAVFPDAAIVAVEPTEAAVMSGGSNGPHRIFGIGDGFIPPIVSGPNGGVHPMIDAVETISSDAAIEAAHELRREFRLCVGISSGANWRVARRLREKYSAVATILPDGFSKYTSHGLIACADTGCPFEGRCPEPIPVRKGIGGIGNP